MAMRIAVELVEALRYKLQMFGVPIEGPTNVFCDNEAVTKNVIFPESTLKKKHNAIAYHRTRKAVAAGTIRVTKGRRWENKSGGCINETAPASNERFCMRSIHVLRRPRFIRRRAVPGYLLDMQRHVAQIYQVDL